MSDSNKISGYGKIEVTLNALLEEKGISISQLSDMIHCRPAKLKDLRNGSFSKLQPDLLARICYVLSCDLTDLITYKNPDVSAENQDASNSSI